MSGLKIFENPEFGRIRSVEISGEPWLVGKDVAAALRYSDTDQALRKHVDEEDKLTRQIDGSGQNRNMTVINESGLYSLILSSKLPGAKKFKRWVTSEVLPSIRKTGTYATPPLTAKLRPLTTDDYLKAATIVAECRNERLPYVLDFLKQGGFDISRVELPRGSSISIQKTRALVRIEDFL